ncbi:hypothetical protein Bca101_005353 [Brassica carinata]
MGRSPLSADETGLKKGPWLPEEDGKLISYIHKHGHSSWSALPKLAGRTDNEIKNFWNTHLKKKLIQMGFDPMTHRPRTDDIFSSLSQLMSLSNLRGLVDLQQQVPFEDQQALQNLQGEMAKLQLLNYLLQAPHLAMSSSNNNNPNELSILNLLIKENYNTNNLPSLKTLEENLFSQNNSPIWSHEPPSLNQTMMPSHDPSPLGDDLVLNQASSSHEQEVAATGSVDWPDHLFDDSMFP